MHFFQSAWKRIVGYFLAGVFTILPLAITVAVVAWVAELIKGWVGPGSFVGRRLEDVGERVLPTQTLAYWIGWIVVLAAIFLLGIAVEVGARQLLHKLVHAVVSRIPLASSIYSTAHQLVGMMDKKDDADLKGMRVVYCTFSQESSSGLLALMPTSERFRWNGRDCHVVYLPTSPLPMTGGLLFVPVECVSPVEMTVDGLMSIYLSMGVTAPQILLGEGQQPT